MTRLKQYEIDNLIRLSNKALSGRSTGELVTDNELRAIGKAMMELLLLRNLENVCLEMEAATETMAKCRDCEKQGMVCVEHTKLRERMMSQWDIIVDTCKDSKK
jgi:hypothetical protein